MNNTTSQIKSDHIINDYKKLINSDRLIRDAEHLMNSSFWIDQLKNNKATGIGNQLICRYFNFQNILILTFLF